MIVEMDSQLVFNALNSLKGDGSPIDMLVQDCKALVSSCVNIRFSLVRRSTNSAAYTVAKALGSISGPLLFGVN